MITCSDSRSLLRSVIKDVWLLPALSEPATMGEEAQAAPWTGTTWDHPGSGSSDPTGPSGEQPSADTVLHNLPRDLEPEPPREAVSKLPAHRNCERGKLVVYT